MEKGALPSSRPPEAAKAAGLLRHAQRAARSARHRPGAPPCPRVAAPLTHSQGGQRLRCAQSRAAARRGAGLAAGVGRQRHPAAERGPAALSARPRSPRSGGASRSFRVLPRDFKERARLGPPLLKRSVSTGRVWPPAGARSSRYRRACFFH